MNIDSQKKCFKLSAGGVIWREWEGLYAVFFPRDESTHFIDPISSIVFEQLKNANQPLSLDNLVSCVTHECADDADSEQIFRLLDERLPQLERIGLIEAIPEQ